MPDWQSMLERRGGVKLGRGEPGAIDGLYLPTGGRLSELKVQGDVGSISYCQLHMACLLRAAVVCYSRAAGHMRTER